MKIQQNSRLRAHRSALVAGLLVCVLTGCGLFQRAERVYVDSREMQPLAVPPDLDAPKTVSSFEIPGYALPELAASGNQALPPKVLPSSEAEKARSRIRFGPTGLYLEVDDEPASVWRRLGFALNRGEMSVEQVLPDQRQYRVRFTHEPILVSKRNWFTSTVLFWKPLKFLDYSGSYLFEVQRATPETTRVMITDAEGRVLPMEQAEFILSRLQQRLG